MILATNLCGPPPEHKTSWHRCDIAGTSWWLLFPCLHIAKIYMLYIGICIYIYGLHKSSLQLLTVWKWVAAGNPRRFVTIILSLLTIFNGRRWMRSSPPASPRLMIIAFLRKSTKWTVPGWHVLPCCQAVLNSWELCVEKRPKSQHCRLAIHDMNRLQVARVVTPLGMGATDWGWILFSKSVFCLSFQTW